MEIALVQVSAGLALHLELRNTPDYDAGPNDNPADPNVAMDEDENLPWPDPQPIAVWWQAHAGDFQSGVGSDSGAVPDQRAGASPAVSVGWPCEMSKTRSVQRI